MELRVVASSPNSSSKPVFIRWDRSPCSIVRAPASRRSTRRESSTAIKSIKPPPSNVATPAASRPLRRKSW